MEQTTQQQSDLIQPIVPQQPTVNEEKVEPEKKHKSFWDFQLNLLKGVFTNWDFSRRISVREYQYLFVTLFILQFLVAFLGWDVASIFGLFAAVVSVKMWIGRLKDMNSTPWALLLLIVPLVNIILLLLLLFKRGTKGPNKYGEDVNGDYRKECGVKRYYGLIQILIFLVLWALILIPLIALSLLMWWMSQFPIGEVMEQMQQFTWSFNVNFSWNEVIMSWNMWGVDMSWTTRTGF